MIFRNKFPSASGLPRFSLLFISVLLFVNSLKAQETYKDLMEKPQINVYDVIKAAEKHFETRDQGQGSGWKGFQRWKYRMERRFWPTGDRSHFDPEIVTKEYTRFKEQYDIDATARQTGNGYYWTDLGPAYASNFLPPAYACGVGRVETVWADGGNGDTLYIGSRSGGFWKSLDGGSTWHSTTQHLPALGVVDIAVHHQRHNEVLILTRHPTGYTHGVLKSTDFGETWNATGLAFNYLNYVFPKKILIPIEAPDTVYVSTGAGFYRSADAGNTWIQLNTSFVRDFATKPGAPATIYALTTANNNQVLISYDGGNTWPVNTTIPGNAGAGGRVATSAAQPDWVYFQSSSGVYKSTDSGLNFSSVGASPANMAFGVNDVDANTLVFGGLDQYLSSDGGLSNSLVCSWFDPGQPNYVHADGRRINSYNGTMYICTDGYLGKSTDFGNSWNILNLVGTPIREYYRIGITPMHAGMVAGGSQDNGTSMLIDNTWWEWLGADGMVCHIDRNNSRNWFGTYQYGNMRYSSQNGMNNIDINPNINGGNWVTDYNLDACNDNTLFAGYDYLYKSRDNGATWQTLANFTGVGNLDEIAVSPADSNYIYVAKANRIWRSTNNGVSFIEVTSGLPNQFISSIAPHPANASHLVVSMTGFNAAQKIYRSTNGGLNWLNYTGNLPNYPTNCAVYEEGPAERVYLAMDVGVFYRDNSMANWALFADSLPAVEVTDLKINNGAHLLYAGTWGRGAWCTSLVGKADFPQITRMIIDPEPTTFGPTERDSMGVTAIITDDGNIVEATLHWGLSPGNYPNPISLIPLTGDTFRLVSKIPPQPTNSQVYFRIEAIDNNGDTTWTTKIVTRIKAAVLCEAAGALGTGSDYINKVALSPGGFIHSSGQDYYGDFRNFYFPVLTRGNSYSINVGLAFHFAPDTVFAWADWDNNLSFSAGEGIAMSALDPSHNSYGSFIVPQNAVSDTIILRVRNIYDNNAFDDPCNDYFGEVEDYSLVIEPLPVGFEGSDPVPSQFAQPDLKLYPVPANEQLWVETIGFKALSESPYELRVFDLLGREIKVRISHQENTNLLLDLNDLSPGTYFVEFSCENQKATAKFHIMK